ncbi:MAG: Eco57I restriction-modification methylase domain-containing protein [Tepidisphaeraceae bacterium]
MGNVPDTVKRLVDRFDQQSDQIRSPDYNETLIRIDFINPLMSELGWDMDNRAGYAEQYREVVHEDRVKVAGQTKAPDYSFRIGGQRKFFLEAKKPAVNIRDNWEPAYQLRRYAWSAKLACSLLTDFEEFAIYDARLQPKQMEKASVARREFFKYTEYEARWDFLYGTFSKDAVLRGEFDRYCESKKGRGAALFDDVFLSEIEDWRKALASNLARNNASLDEPSLNFAVQRIIDRILFLRIAEDRGTEPVGQLQALLNGDAVYPRLVTLFNRADERYNSGLFHFAKEKDRDEAPDTLTPTLDVSDKTLKDIVKGLYYPQSPYEFTMVSADILGSVYERFLGKVITLTSGHNAKIEEKPEVRKAGGVYYTPVYIVDYIVKNTVGRLLEGVAPATPGRPEGRASATAGQETRPPTRRSATVTDAPPPLLKPPTLRILDPACGSGSFLIGAYQFLLDWYLQHYLACDNPTSLATGKKPVLRPSFSPSPGTPGEGRGEGRQSFVLTIAERKRILLDHIHGVDLDSQAVEVTKLNLLLKCLEGETSQTLGFEGRLFRERALPDLGKNILCGNSLIGTDIIGTPAWEKMSEDERARVNPFDYERVFPQVFKGKGGGFDAVIGNPPYLYSAFQEVDYPFATKFTWMQYQTDIYAVFVERALGVARSGSTVGMIVSDSWLKGENFSKMRQSLLKTFDLREVVTFNYAPFKDAAIENSMIFAAKQPPTTETFNALRLASPSAAPTLVTVKKQTAIERGLIDVLSNDDAIAAVHRMDVSKHRIKDFFFVNRGVHAYRTDGYGQTRFGKGPQTLRDKEERSYHAASQLDASYMKEFKGKHVFRYYAMWAGEWLSYGDWLAESREPKYFTGEKVVVRKVLGTRLSGTFFDEPAVIDQSLYVLVPRENRKVDLKIALALLVSSIGAWYFRTKYSIYDTLYPWYTTKQLAAFPMPCESCPRLVTLVDAMLSLHKRLAAEKLPQKREQIEREIAATDRQIDQLVYQLYGLTDEEIAIVEAATA